METTIETKVRAAMQKAAEFSKAERVQTWSLRFHSAMRHRIYAESRAKQAHISGDKLLAQVWERQQARYSGVAAIMRDRVAKIAVERIAADTCKRIMPEGT